MRPVPERLTAGGRRKSPLPMSGLLLCMVVLTGDAYADIYMYTDKGGTPSFSNVPTDARYVLVLRTQEGSPSGSTGPRSIDREQQQKLKPEITRVAFAFHLDPALLHAVITTESNYDARAVSAKGAMGLMQLMPETARLYGAIDPFDPGQNIRAGARHLSDLLRRFDNDLQLALAAYNSGENNVARYGERIPPFPETAAYVPRVMGLYRKYQREIR